MITREEYNKALDIVEEYHKQIFLGVKNPTENKEMEAIYDYDLLKVGDEVICLNKNGNTKHLTIGRKYGVISNIKNHWGKNCAIIKNDIRKKYRIDLLKGDWVKVPSKLNNIK
jgi:hypothetical protein